MCTRASCSFKFLSALAFLLILTHFDKIVTGEAAPGSADAYIARQMARFHLPGFSAAGVKNGNALKRKTYEVSSFNLPGHQPIDRLVSVMRILTGMARMGRAFAGINGHDDFRVRQGDYRRPGFMSGRLVRAIYGRFAERPLRDGTQVGKGTATRSG